MNSKMTLWIVCVLVLTGFALPALFAAPEGAGERVEWQKGEKWAFGAEEDFTYVFDEIFNELKSEIDEEAGGFVEYSYENEGVVGFYYQSEVVDDANDLYKVTSTAAFYFHVFFGMNLDIARVPVEGNHTNVTEGEDANGHPTWEGVTTIPMNIKAEAGLDVVAKVTQSNYFTQDGLNLQKMEISFEVGTEYIVQGKNIPEIHYSEESTYDWETDEETYEWMDVTYHDIGWEGRVSADVNFDIGFSPAVNLFDLPIEEGEIWNGTTDITISGDIGGVIDLKKPSGVPQEIFDEFYDGLNEGVSGAEISKRVNKWSDLFPLYIPNDWLPFEDLDENLVIQNNRFVLKETTIEDQDYSFTTGENRTITPPGGEPTKVYEIVPYEEKDDENRSARNDEDWEEESPSEDLNLFVAPDNGRLMKIEVESEILEEAGVEIEAEPVEPEVAKTIIETKANPKKPKEGGTNENRQFSLLKYSGSGEDEAGYIPAYTLGTAVVAVGVSGLMFRRRKR